MTEAQFKSLIDLIEAIVNEGVGECYDEPPAFLLEARKYTEKCQREAYKLLVNPEE